MCKNSTISDSNIPIEETVVRLLTENGLRVATAESCTGGLTAQKITSVSGASECFDCGVVTYSNGMKHKLLGVSTSTLEKFGAVSDETALEMCKGVCLLAGADFGIGITGIAGPGGGTKEKPVGLVHIGIYGQGIHCSHGYLFSGNRSELREKSANCALELVRRAVLRIDLEQ